MKKQTAVEWLIFHLMELDKKYSVGEIGRIDYRNRMDAIQSEAKEMEKQQIIDAFYDCKLSIIIKEPITADQYYTENYESNR